MAELQRVTTAVCTLLHADRKDWPVIEPLRAMQRVLVAGLVRRETRRGLQKVNQMCEAASVAEIMAMHDEGAGVYVRVNVESHAWRYVGFTKDFLRRDREHLREEAGRGVVNQDSESKYYTFARRHGGAGTWIDIPLRAWGQLIILSVRRLEKTLIREGGSLNIAGQKRYVAAKKTGQKRRRRPVRSLRKQSEETLGPKNKGIIMYTDNHCSGQSYSCLLECINAGGESIEVSGHGREQTRSQLLQRDIGDSTVLVTYVDGYSLRGALSEGHWRTGGKIGLEGVATIVVEKLIQRQQSSDHETAVHSLCSNISINRQQTHLGGLHNVNAFTKRVWKITFQTKLIARVPDGAPRQVKAAVREGMKLLLHNADRGINRAVAVRLGESLRVTNTITGVLARWRQDYRKFDEGHEPECA